MTQNKTGYWSAAISALIRVLQNQEAMLQLLSPETDPLSFDTEVRMLPLQFSEPCTLAISTPDAINVTYSA